MSIYKEKTLVGKKGWSPELDAFWERYKKAKKKQTVKNNNK